jgi:predicted phosphate transport protein (TIGR00153 family)
VKLSLVPKEREFFRDFSEMAANLEKAAQILVELMDHYDEARSRAREILEHEHVGDKIVHDVVQRLNRTFVTPLEREDIYDLASTMDEILDSIEATADSMIIYKITEVQPQAKEMAVVISKATSVLRTCVDQLEKRPKNISDYWIEVNRLENDGDRLYRDAVAELFDDDMKCTDIIKWKDVYATLEKAVDDCEHVANILESIVLKNT